MRNLHSVAVLSSLALLGACAVNHADNPQAGDVGTCASCGTADGTGGSDGSATDGGGSGAAACPLGAAEFTADLGASDVQQKLSMAIDPSGNVAVGAAGQVAGFRQLSTSGQVLKSLAFGSQVAADSAGDIFIAGAFSSRIDLGGGRVLVPQGNVDVFLIELDASGNVVLAKSLGLCGDGIDALAVARDGRIAISGSALGTVVLDANGNLLLTLAPSGHVAFSAQGELAIAGVDSNAHAFVTLVDRAGAAIFEHTFDGTATINGVAVDAAGNVVLVGTTTDFIDVLGTTITAIYDTSNGPGFPTPLVNGAFAVKLDAAGNKIYATRLYIAFGNAVAIGPDGRVYIAATTQGFNGPEVATSGQLLRIDSDNPDNGITSFGVASLFRGTYNAIGFDACGAVFLGGAGFQSGPPTDALVVKLSGIEEQL